jgi:hypothetical protein
MINEVFNKIDEAIGKELGEGWKLEDGETLVFQLNDCVLVLGYEDGQTRMEFVGGKPISVDVTTGFYEEEGGLDD